MQSNRQDIHVPKLGHFIWVGFKPAPDKYLKKLMAWVMANQMDGFQFILWIDSLLASPHVISSYVNFFKLNGINIEDCTDNRTSEAPLIIKDLNTVIENKELYEYLTLRLNRNFGEISDEARFRILKVGGFYGDLPDVEPGAKRLIETGLFDRTLKNHVFACDYAPQQPDVPDCRNYTNLITSTDAFITSANNPLINLVHKKIVSNLIDNDLDHQFAVAYSQDDFYRTIYTTGPQVLINIVKFAIKQGSIFTIQYDSTTTIDLPPLRDRDHTFITPSSRFNEGLTWFCTPTIPITEITGKIVSSEEAVEVAFSIAIQTLLFEMSYIGVLRLDSIIDELIESTQLPSTLVQNRLLDELKALNIDYSSIELAQLTYKYPGTELFYRENNLISKTYSSLPLDKDNDETYLHFFKTIDSLSCRRYILSSNQFGLPDNPFPVFQKWLRNFLNYLEKILKNISPSASPAGLLYIYDIIDNPLYENFIKISYKKNPADYDAGLQQLNKIRNTIRELLKEKNQSIDALHQKFIPNPNKVSSHGVSFFTHLIRTSNFYKMHVLLSHPLIDLAPADGNDNVRALFEEICKNEKQILALLIILIKNPAARAILEKKDVKGRNLLHYLAEADLYNYETEEALSGLDLNTLVNSADSNGTTPIHLAVEVKATDSACNLLARVSSQTIYNNRGFSPLHIACLSDDNIFIEEALQNRPDIFNPNECDKQGNSPLKLCIIYRSLNALEALLPDNRLIIRSEENQFLLCLLILYFNKETKRIEPLLHQLLKLGANASETRLFTKKELARFSWIQFEFYKQESFILSPLHLSIIFNLPEVAKLLMHHGADPKYTNENGISPIQLAVFLRRENIFNLMHSYSITEISIFETRKTEQDSPRHLPAP